MVVEFQRDGINNSSLLLSVSDDDEAEEVPILTPLRLEMRSTYILLTL